MRLLTLGLCAVAVFLLATPQPVRVEIIRPVLPGPVHRAHLRPAARPDAPPLSVVDVAEQIAPADLTSLVPLKPGERVSAINDQALDSDLAAGSLIASRGLRAGEYLDLTVSSGTTERRVLVLLH